MRVLLSSVCAVWPFVVVSVVDLVGVLVSPRGEEKSVRREEKVMRKPSECK